MVGYWATLSLNIPDFTRYAKNQDSQIVGQAFGLPVAMVLYSFIGIACTSASEKIFGEFRRAVGVREDAGGINESRAFAAVGSDARL